MVIAHPGQDVELLCTGISSENQTIAWQINNEGPYRINSLHNSILAGYSSNRNNLIVQNIMTNDARNRSNYNCVISSTTAILRQSNPIILYVAGEYQCM